MKALTVYQPWASLIVAGAKPYEFRGWNPRNRGAAYAALIGQRIVIHASARKIDRTLVLGMYEMQVLHAPLAAEMCLHREKALPILDAALTMTMKGADGSIGLPMSAGIGTAVLGEPRNGLEIAEEFGVPRANDSDRDAHANYGWPMLEIEPWEQPIPMRGLQGFWNWPTPEGVGL